MEAKAPTPQGISDHLGTRVVGQEEAVSEISIALAKKLGQLPVGNVLISAGGLLAVAVCRGRVWRRARA